MVQQALDACTPENVSQMEQALDSIYRQHSHGYQHDYTRDWQLLDVDMSGMPCGPKAAFGSPGYFAKQRNRRGRQVGRRLPTRYGEVVVDRLFDGKTQLAKALQPLMEAAEQTLALDERQRQRTLVRLDAGGGSVDDVNWLLSQGYQVHGKDYSTSRAQRLAQSVSVWVDDPKVEGRQVGWVRLPASEYVRPVRRLAVRCRKANGQWGVGVLISTMAPAEVLALTQQAPVSNSDPASVRLSYVSLYDQRGGGVETSFKGDHQGLGSTTRSKKRFAAQQMVILLGSLAHNVIVWAHEWLNAPAPLEPEQAQPTRPSCREPLPHYGPLRMVRDVFHMSGFLRWDACGHLVEIVLNQDALLARRLLFSLRQLLAPMHVAINLGQT